MECYWPNYVFVAILSENFPNLCILLVKMVQWCSNSGFFSSKSKFSNCSTRILWFTSPLPIWHYSGCSNYASCTWPLSHFSNFIALREDEENVMRINQCNRSRAFEMWNRFVCLSIRAWLVTFDCCHVTGVRLVSICDLSIFCMLFVPFTLALYEKIRCFPCCFSQTTVPLVM